MTDEPKSNMQIIGEHVAESIDFFEQDSPDMRVEEVVLVMAIREKDDEGREITTVRYACTDDRQWIARGILEEALDVCRWGTVASDDEA